MAPPIATADLSTSPDAMADTMAEMTMNIRSHAARTERAAALPRPGGRAANSQCPMTGMKIYNEAQEEMDRVRKAYRTFAPTGCTPEFCQSGRMTRINEPRVGRDRPLAEIQQEATDFLQECHEHGVIKSEQELAKRIQQALVQISNTAKISTITDRDGNVSEGLAGGTWHQSPKELEYGLRAAWRNARRCIMRSEHEILALCDLRKVKTSREMARTILKGMLAAFNNGHILPTAFIFPPRLPGQRGPMVWNGQIMAFAGYEQEDGSILGDPANVDLTKNMIKFGWKPPVERTRWDMLPLITMAEGDAPYMMELPLELRRQVRITHPRYAKEFKELDLRWVLAPALSRLGFDIGGVQYTASPFIGWFMDAEIGVRNLGDDFRYNVLPDVIEALKLSPEPETPFEDLPEYMHMVAMSRAQAELNFAVYYSYLHEHVSMIDTLSSSMQYLHYDAERSEDTGHRLPADPYWIAPPQGSIVPIWHKGGLPNYQPKPMICHHVQDPIKAWKREAPDSRRMNSIGLIRALTLELAVRPRVRIFSCTAGVNARKMAQRLHVILKRLVVELEDGFDIEPEKPLNQLDLSASGPEDVILIIASTTGRGEMPKNAQKFVERYAKAQPMQSPPRFSCFANGDSTYGDTYNAAAKRIFEIMTNVGCRPLLDHCYAGDTALHNPDWDSFNQWVENIDHLILGNDSQIDLPPSLTDLGDQTTALVEMPTATLVRINRLDPKGIVQITLDIGDLKYQEMDHIKILSPNPRNEVGKVLQVLELAHDSKLEWHHQNALDFLSRYVDLDHAFKDMTWYNGFDSLSANKQAELRAAKVIDALAAWRSSAKSVDADAIERIFKSMPSICPRLYSVASCPTFATTNAIQEEGSGTLVDIFVKVNEGGRFSHDFLSQSQPGHKLRFGLTSPDTWKLIQAQKPSAPFVAIATGSGIGPVRALLQRRMADLHITSGEGGRTRTKTFPGPASSVHSGSRRSSVSSTSSGTGRRLPKDINHHAHLGVSSTKNSVSLFVGFKTEDSELIRQVIRPAHHAGIVDMVELCPSNSNKTRIQDHLLLPHVADKLKTVLEDPACIVFVCANEKAADASVANLSKILGRDVKDVLGDRYVEEIFRS